MGSASEYNALARAVRKAHQPPKDTKPPTAAEIARQIAAIRLEQSREAKDEWTRRLLASLETPAIDAIDDPHIPPCGAD